MLGDTNRDLSLPLTPGLRYPVSLFCCPEDLVEAARSWGTGGDKRVCPNHSCPRAWSALSDREVASPVLWISMPLPLKADSSLSQARCPACGLERADQLWLRLEIPASPDCGLSC